MPATSTTEKKEELLDSLSKGLALLRLFATGVPAMSIQEVSEKLDVTRAAARRLLLTLQHHGYVTQNGRLFSITPRVMELGYAYFASMKLPSLARTAMQGLAAEIRETCSLGVLDGESVVLIAREEPEQLLRIDMSVGRRMPAYAHSMGRVLLAQLEADQRQQYLRCADRRKLTRFTVTSRAGLERILNQVRADGYCVLISEMVDGIAGLSVPVHDQRGSVIAAMGVSMVLGSRGREDVVRHYLPPLQRAAESVRQMLNGFQV